MKNKVSDMIMSSKTISLAYLAHKIHVTPLRLEQILSIYPDVYTALTDNIQEGRLQNWTWLKRFSVSNLLQELDTFQDSLTKHDIQMVSYDDELYPAQFKILTNDWPVVLYYQGQLAEALHKPSCTVVGARNYTRYAQSLLEKILKPASEQGLQIVSGLALGVDGLAHQVSLQTKTPTVSIIGSGLDPHSFSPSSHLHVKQKIIDQGGVVISEYAPGVAGSKYSFPRRNRLLAAWSELTWVVQATQKSGTLITAGLARDLGKIVATTPGSILEESLAGNLQLLKDGANIITDPEDIWQLLGLTAKAHLRLRQTLSFNSELEKNIYSLLKNQPLTIDTLSEKTQMNLQQLVTTLSMLEIQGYVTSFGENMWSVNQ